MFQAAEYASYDTRWEPTKSPGIFLQQSFSIGVQNCTRNCRILNYINTRPEGLPSMMPERMSGTRYWRIRRRSLTRSQIWFMPGTELSSSGNASRVLGPSDLTSVNSVPASDVSDSAIGPAGSEECFGIMWGEGGSRATPWFMFQAVVESRRRSSQPVKA